MYRSAPSRRRAPVAQNRAGALVLGGGALAVGLALLVLCGLAGRQAAAHPVPPAAAPVLPTGHAPAPGAGRIAPRTVMTNGWTNLFPRLSAVSMISSTEGWASGEYGRLLHFSNSTWQVADPPLMQGVDLPALSMVPAGVGWIAAGAHAYQYDGATWNERSAGLGGSGFSIERISTVSLNDAWATTHGPSCGSYSQILHWDGSQWTATLPPNSPYDLYDIAMTGPNDGWAVGGPCVGSTFLLHYDGTSWTPVPGPGDPGLGYFWRIWAGPPGDAWMLAATNDGTRRSIYHDAHGVWTSWTLPVATSPYAIYMANDGEGWVGTDQGIYHWDGTAWLPEYSGGYWLGLAGVGGQAWAAGIAGAVFTRAGGGGWQQQTGGPTFRPLSAVSALSLDDAWAVGAGGTILHGQSGAWNGVTSPITADLSAVQMLAPATGYAAGGSGSSGVIARWDGVSWRPVATTTMPLYGLSMTGAGTGWAVGAGGAIWRAVGDVWSQVASPTQYDLRAVALDSPGHGWAVGGYNAFRESRPVLLEYTGGAWVDQTVSLPYGAGSLGGLALAPGGQPALVVGTDSNFPSGVILRWNNGVWTLDAGTYGSLRGVALDRNGTAWAVGGVWHYSGGAWQPVALPIGYLYPLGSPGPIALALEPGRGGWAVGPYGVVLRYDAPGPVPSPTPTAGPSATAAPSWTDTPSATPPTPPATTTSTAIPTSTSTSTAVPTGTPTSTSTAVPTGTPTSTSTAAPTGTPTSTSTAAPTGTPTSTSTAVPTGTPTSTSTASPTPSMTPMRTTPTSTAVPATRTPPTSVTPTLVPTGTPVPSSTALPPTGTPPRATPTGVPATGTAPPSATPAPATSTARPSATPAPATGTARPSATPALGTPTTTPCSAQFTDVHPADYFYTPVLYLACHGVVSGYSDGSYRPYNTTTRAQMVKIVVLGFGLPIVTPAGGQYTFADVPPDFPFFAVIETAAAHNIVSGYACGGPNEPCDPQRRPYFRPYASVTRGQLSKITVVAARWPLLNPVGPDTFADVPPSSPFYPFVETAACHGIISGYTCGRPGEPCDPAHRPYFRQYTGATRGQIAKIVYLGLTGTSPCPAPTAAP